MKHAPKSRRLASSTILGATVAFGIVLRNGVAYLTIASELGADQLTDGTLVEQIPHGSIKKIRMLGSKEITAARL